MRINEIPREIGEYVSVHKRKKVWLIAVTCLAAVVVFCTTYALILPAITLEADQKLACSYTVHQHDKDKCYDGNGEVNCGYADYVVHTHDKEYCYDASGILICPLSELELHKHDSSCYVEQSVLVCGETVSNGHVHDSTCYTSVQGGFICQNTDADHEHTDECYEWTNELTCGMKEGEGSHQHTGDCYHSQNTLICGKDEIILHTHSDSCYDNKGNRICGLPQVEEHTHTEECLQSQSAESNVQSGLTEEEQAQVDEVIALIDALPGYEEIFDTLTAYDEAGDTEGYDAYLTEVQLRVSEVYAAYSALTSVQQEAVTNVDTLLALVEALGTDSAETADITEVPEEVLAQLAEEQGIYPGTKSEKTDENGNEVWTVLNRKDAAEADVKATVTLPSGVTTDEMPGYYLFIRAVGEDDPYYPDPDTVEAELGECNAIQCYAIHWVNIYCTQEDNVSVGDYKDQNGNVIGSVYADNSGDKWICVYNTSSVLNTDSYATIDIDYLKESAYLSGEKAHRKLRVFNSRKVDGTELEGAHSTLTDVTATDENYTGFTFQTNRGGPYVFASQRVYEGYVSALNITSLIDGSEPFDSDNDKGNDSGNNNQIVRSYDVIQYDLTATFAARQAGVISDYGKLYFEVTLDKDVTEAAFETSKMLQLGNNYEIVCLDKDDNIVLTRKADGNYYDATNKKVDLNSIVSGSGEGTESYTTEIVKQKLVGYVELTVGENGTDNNVLAGTKTFRAAVQVLNAVNGDTFEPTFKAWFDGNKENYGSESSSDGKVQLSVPETGNAVTADGSYAEGKYKVTVSAAAKFNLELAKNSNVSYKSWFDSSKGIEVTGGSTASYTIQDKSVTGAQIYELLEGLADLEENTGIANPEDFTDEKNACSSLLNDLPLSAYKPAFENIRYGRITGYGITLQVYNSIKGSDDTAAKGFKGISLPQGDVDFAMKLATVLTDTDKNPVDDNNYYAVLWEYNENESKNSGKQARNIYWGNLSSTKFAAWAAPYNGSYTGHRDKCYYGGQWALTSSNDEAGSYGFKVNGYDFNFGTLGLTFPTHKAGNGAATDGYNTYIGCFSSGFIQVLNVFPRHQKNTVTVSTTVTVRDLALQTTDETKVSTDKSDPTGYAQETNISDNYKPDSIPLYAKGKMTKANAFCKKELFENAGSSSIDGYFLGTYFWGTSYDCSAYAGQDITLAGAARIDAGDYQIRHMNMLQLFDSAALSIDRAAKAPYVVSNVEGSIKGETTILYAADPDYPHGYDTNKGSTGPNGKKVSGYEVMRYMSTIREEDLKYYTSLENLEADGYTCIGVMAELRDWTINGEGGYSTVLKIPMKVSGSEDFVGKTVCTVNAVRIWTNENDMKVLGTDGSTQNVSWKDGTYDEALGKNSVTGYTPVDTSSDEHYSGQVANGSAYWKTEYKNGEVVLGSNTNGYVFGSSLLILSYEAKVGITVDATTSSGTLPTCDLDKGNCTVNYRLTGIKTAADNIGQSQPATTALTVLAKLDKDYSGEQRIEVSAGSYSMVSAGNIVLVDEKGEKIDSVKISDNSDSPTTVNYKFASGNEEKIYTITVYAVPDTNKTQVTFHLSGVTVGVDLPNITFDAEVNPTEVVADKDGNIENIISYAYISGSGDVRAYTTVNGNMSSQAVGLIQLSATRLSKEVDTNYIELDGEFTYTVTYTNGGSGQVGFYLNDLLPIKGDTRGSDYEGTLGLTGVDARLGGSSTFTADVTFYYSTMSYEELRTLVDLSNADNRDTTKIKELLANTTYFTQLGYITSGQNSVTYSEAYNNLSDKADITGIYVVVEKLSANNSLNIDISVKASGNEAGDVYKNVAYSWLGDQSEQLTSRMVETTVLSRAISGRVWYDANLNGVYDDGETLLNGVECTLFKWAQEKGEYVSCEKDVTGAEIEVITTGADGSYIFPKLAAGDYIVAFSGNALEKYTGATTYQVNSKNDGTSSDGVALIDTKSSLDTKVSISGIESGKFSYAIAYSLNSESTTVGEMPLHSIDDILNKNISLTNYVELYDHQDLGLIIAGYELPKTGGAGTTLFTIGGLLFMACAAGCGYGLRRRRERRAMN